VGVAGAGALDRVASLGSRRFQRAQTHCEEGKKEGPFFVGALFKCRETGKEGECGLNDVLLLSMDWCKL
jgi:hypothetical protein